MHTSVFNTMGGVDWQQIRATRRPCGTVKSHKRLPYHLVIVGKPSITLFSGVVFPSPRFLRSLTRNMFHLITLFLILLSKSTPVYSNPARLRNFARHEHTPNATEIVPGIFQRLHKRQVTSIVSTCGYYNGDLKSSRTADVGFGCRVDTSNGLWGFCPTTVLTATDCGLAGYCVDRHSCRGGCGRLSNRKDITTVNW
jgi:hypothetical protein